MLNLSGLNLIAPFFSPPENPRGLGREWVQKNRTHLNGLVARAVEVRKEFFEEIESLNGYFPIAPEQSSAHVFICKAAAKLAGPWEVSFLVKMLWWNQVLNARDNSYMAILLEAISQKGYSEDAEALEKFHRELGKPERLYYQDGTGALIPFPGMIRLREEVRRAIKSCRSRGLRDKSVSDVFLWSSAGY